MMLRLEKVGKSFGKGKARLEVLRDINLSVATGEFLAILGFSGSGKSTLISLMSGLLKPDEGNVLLKEKVMNGPGPDRGVVFQNYSLLPWLTVRENVALAVDALFRDWSLERRQEHIARFIRMVNLSPAVDKRPHELSGGMRQRVSLARTLAMNPEIIFFDEPLSALDALTRATLQTEIERIWEQDRKTVVLITNDVDEAILLADRIILLNPGPGATLGPEFSVPFARPRQRKVLNSDPHFKRIRNDIVTYFLDIKKENHRKGRESVLSLPDIKPTAWKGKSL